ncbi:MAG: EamA family transporter [Opitutales bacterium]|nr:EamA family transporter [Opitutales bacterium]
MHAAVITAFLFALTGVCATQASRLLGAAQANLWRLVVALILLGLWAHSWGQGLLGGPGFWFFAAGGIGFGFGGWCVFQSLRRIGSTLTLLVVECAAAILAGAIAWLWLGAALSVHEIGFALLILTGVVIGASPRMLPESTPAKLWAGLCFASSGALFQALSFNLSRHAFNLLEADGLQLDSLTAAYQRLVGGALVALCLFAITRIFVRHSRTAKLPEKPFRSPLPAPVWVGLNALFGPVLGVSCMLWAIRLVENPGLVQSVAATATLLTIPFAWWLEQTRPGWRYYCGCALALVGVLGLLGGSGGVG